MSTQEKMEMLRVAMGSNSSIRKTLDALDLPKRGLIPGIEAQQAVGARDPDISFPVLQNIFDRIVR